MSKPVISIVGRLGQDPEAIKGGVKFSVATDVGTAKSPKTDWYNVVVWSNTLAEFVNKYLKKGSSVVVAGKQELKKVDGGSGFYVNVTGVDIQFGMSSGKKQEGDAPKAESKEEEISF